jgi:hypothetical protein
MSDKMKAIRVASEKEFERLLDHMAQEAHRASDHWHLFKGLYPPAGSIGLRCTKAEPSGISRSMLTMMPPYFA